LKANAAGVRTAGLERSIAVGTSIRLDDGGSAIVRRVVTVIGCAQRISKTRRPGLGAIGTARPRSGIWVAGVECVSDIPASRDQPPADYGPFHRICAGVGIDARIPVVSENGREIDRTSVRDRDRGGTIYELVWLSDVHQIIVCSVGRTESQEQVTVRIMDGGRNCLRSD